MNRKTFSILLALPFFTAFGQRGERDYLVLTVLEQKLFLEPTIPDDSILLMMAYDSTLDLEKYHLIEKDLRQFIDDLSDQRKKFKADARFMKFIFRETRKKYLHHYVKYAEFNEMFYSGNYNCLTGTALYAYIFKHLGFKAQIKETRYHSFLTISQDRGEFLIESTDTVAGFVNNHERVAKKIDSYQEKDNTMNADTIAIPENKYPCLRLIQMKELAGLHYFNLCVVKFNEAKYEAALTHLRKAELLYPQSERIKYLIAFTTERSSRYPQVERSFNNQINQIQTEKKK